MGKLGAILRMMCFSPLGALIAEVYKPFEANRIAILGMKESGKTQFLKTLQKKQYSKYGQTTVDDYEEFTLVLSSGKKVKIASGKDIGGGDSFVPQYKKIVEDADAVFFVFDVYKFVHNADYREQTRARLQFVDEGLGIPEDKRAVIGSHADQFADDEKKKEGQLFALENLKDVYKPIYNNFFMRDVRKYKQVIEVFDKLL